MNNTAPMIMRIIAPKETALAIVPVEMNAPVADKSWAAREANPARRKTPPIIFPMFIFISDKTSI